MEMECLYHFGRIPKRRGVPCGRPEQDVPQGTVRVSETLNLCATAMAEAGRLGIFTPMHFIHARKPE